MTSFAYGVLGSMRRNFIATIGLLGLVFYLLLYIAYVAFYGQFGVEPNEVGLDYRETVSRGVGAIPMILSLVFVVVLGLGAIYGLWWAFLRLARFVGLVPRRASLLAPFRDVVAFATVYGLAGGVIFVIVFIATGVPDDAAHVKAGGIIESRDFYQPYSAERASLSVIGGGAPKRIQEATRHELRYLGAAHGVFVLYDVDAQRTIQVPTSLVVLTIETPSS
jgi:hypothetical protein